MLLPSFGSASVSYSVSSTNRNADVSSRAAVACRAVKQAREHREEEHTSHMRVMRLSMLRQQRLKDEVHDMKVLTQYRSYHGGSAGALQATGAEKLPRAEGEIGATGVDDDGDRCADCSDTDCTPPSTVT